jgi:hypothetical protein
MDRAALGRELFDLHQAMKSQLFALKLDAGLAAPDLPGEVAAAVARMTVLVARAEALVAGYIASADSGAHRST